ncbi:hypothetical protein LTR94_033928, partial [Friedmanniomyces endolithicus]
WQTSSLRRSVSAPTRLLAFATRRFAPSSRPSSSMSARPLRLATRLPRPPSSRNPCRRSTASLRRRSST